MRLIDADEFSKHIEALKDVLFTSENVLDAIDAQSTVKEHETIKPFILSECANQGWYCSKCGRRLHHEIHNKHKKIKYCINCGRRIDWDVNIDEVTK